MVRNQGSALGQWIGEPIYATILVIYFVDLPTHSPARGPEVSTAFCLLTSLTNLLVQKLGFEHEPRCFVKTAPSFVRPQACIHPHKRTFPQTWHGTPAGNMLGKSSYSGCGQTQRLPVLQFCTLQF
eukprot:1160717-Pelagomonas_calceolata.AAC.8